LGTLTINARRAGTTEARYSSQMRFLHHVAAVAIIAATSTAYAQETTEASSRMKSGGMVAGGVGMIVAGLGTAGGAALLTWFSVTSHACSECPGCGCDPPPYVLLSAAIPLDLLAIGSIVGGIAMIALGAHRVNVENVSISPLGLRITW
jgi:hypothetical protein